MNTFRRTQSGAHEHNPETNTTTNRRKASVSDDTVTIDGKNYLKSDIIRYCTPDPLRLFGEPVKYGDRFLVVDQEYICARVGQNELQLIGLESGNRWSDCRSKAEISGIATDLHMFEGANFADVSRVPQSG